MEEVPEKLLAGPFGKRKEAREVLMEPYDVSGYEKGNGKRAKKKKSKKKTSKKAAKKTRRSRMS